MSSISLLGHECRFLPFVRKLCSQTRKGNTISATLADYKIQFSEGTGQKILDTMNKSSPDDLSKYKISNVNITNLIDWKKERGPFKTLSDPLQVDGFDVQLLLEFYKSMGSIKVTQSKRKSHGSGNEKHLIRPELKPNLISSLQSAVAIHLESIGIGWVRLDRSSKVTHWNCEQFSSLPDKMWPVDTFNLAVSLLKKTPPSDVYIFEKSNSLSPQSKTKPLMVSSHSQHLELLSMLMALLNSSSIHNPESNLINNPPTIKNKVFYLKNKMTARLFGTLIGSERVSAIPLVKSIVQKNVDPHKLPCVPVEFVPGMADFFQQQSPVQKEILAKSLMLGITFMNLCILRNANTFNALKASRTDKNTTSET